MLGVSASYRFLKFPKQSLAVSSAESNQIQNFEPNEFTTMFPETSLQEEHTSKITGEPLSQDTESESETSYTESEEEELQQVTIAETCLDSPATENVSESDIRHTRKSFTPSTPEHQISHLAPSGKTLTIQAQFERIKGKIQVQHQDMPEYSVPSRPIPIEQDSSKLTKADYLVESETDYSYKDNTKALSLFIPPCVCKQ